MARQYSVAHAKNNLLALIHDAELGTPVEITRHGKPRVVILAFGDYNRMCGEKPDLWEAIQRFRAEHDLAELDIDSVYRDTRDPAPGTLRPYGW
jgi:prevent-host-death family protein